MGALRAGLFRAVLEADEGRWIAEMRERRSRRLGARDWQFSFAAAAAFVLFAVASAVFVGWGHSASPVLIVTIVATYALAAMVEFEVGAGSGRADGARCSCRCCSPVPLGLVPALRRASGLLLADVPRYVKREAHPERAVPLVMRARYAAGLVMSVLAASRGR